MTRPERLIASMQHKGSAPGTIGGHCWPLGLYENPAGDFEEWGESEDKEAP